MQLSMVDNTERFTWFAALDRTIAHGDENFKDYRCQKPRIFFVFWHFVGPILLTFYLDIQHTGLFWPLLGENWRWVWQIKVHGQG